LDSNQRPSGYEPNVLAYIILNAFVWYEQGLTETDRDEVISDSKWTV
jgi:hypothetical protein